jgi:DNA end-binding protein Ku
LADAEKLNVPKKAEVGKREKEMAEALVKSMTSKWDPEKYKDDYRDALMEVIEEKVESGGEEIEEKPKEKRPSTKVIDLVAVLQESLKAQEGGKKKKAAPKKAKQHKKAA